MSRMIEIGTSSESHLEAVFCTADDGGLDVKEPDGMLHSIPMFST
ncbi:uncharacterized protein G2W53_007128 [Senna tora]|uniref:Uncharacterized protein n=1 Tax=Senna tora TaxID=362788 RepID=A0A835CD94_9FABA|nr:uncharacterized protein G2W53_007128 [Senna tora]